MDIISQIVLDLGNGLITALVGLGVGFLGFKLFKSKIIGAIQSEAIQILTDSDNQAQIKALIWENIINYTTQALKFIHENPEKLTPVLTGLMNDLAKAIPKENVAQVAQNLVGGAASEISGSGGVLQFVPKKWRGIFAIAQMFMGGNSGQPKKDETSSGFG